MSRSHQFLAKRSFVLWETSTSTLAPCQIQTGSNIKTFWMLLNCLHLETFWIVPNMTKYQKTFRHGPNVLWTKCLMNTLDRIKCLLTEPRVWNLSHFQSHVLNPNSKLRLLPPSPFWFWPSKPSFIYLCKFVQTESIGATRADLPPNSTQVWQEPSHLMVQNVFSTSAANPRSSRKLLKPQIISGSYSDQLSGDT